MDIFVFALCLVYAAILASDLVRPLGLVGWKTAAAKIAGIYLLVPAAVVYLLSTQL